MEKIILDEQRVNLLSDTIHNIVKRYSKPKNVRAILMLNYNNRKKNSLSEPTICITLICENISRKEMEDFERKMASDETLISVKEKTGVKINLCKWWGGDYSSLMMHQREFLACRELANSSILYDKNNEFTKLKHSLLTYDFKDNPDIPFSNLIEFEPPLQFVKK